MPTSVAVAVGMPGWSRLAKAPKLFAGWFCLQFDFIELPRCLQGNACPANNRLTDDLIEEVADRVGNHPANTGNRQVLETRNYRVGFSHQALDCTNNVQTDGR